MSTKAAQRLTSLLTRYAKCHEEKAMKWRYDELYGFSSFLSSFIVASNERDLHVAFAKLLHTI